MARSTHFLSAELTLLRYLKRNPSLAVGIGLLTILVVFIATGYALIDPERLLGRCPHRHSALPRGRTHLAPIARDAICSRRWSLELH